MSLLKQSLFDACKDSILQRINIVETSIQQAQQSANEETKSSAGDKYETGRAMAQLEIEKLGAQLNELNRQHQELIRINLAIREGRIGPGSIVQTDQGSFFIAVNAGEMSIDGQKFFTVSSQAPVAKKMFGLTANDSFVLNGRTFTILSVD